MGKVAVITGANTGIGLALAERLLGKHRNLKVCLLCRNARKANTAKDYLQQRFPAAEIDVILCDVSSVDSVTQCCLEMKRRYSHIDWLYLNAGVMQVTGVDWRALIKAFFCLSVSDLAVALTTGHGLIRQADGGVTPDGLQCTFATNLFGHFLMIRELMDILGGECTTQIIWTSSTNADKRAFSIADIQHKNGRLPYSSSKYGMDLLSYEINSRLNSKGIYSHASCPGLVMTNLTNGILPGWIWMLVIPFLVLLRLIAPSMTVSPFNGSEALFWLSNQPPEGLDPLAKFHSKVSIFSRQYVTTEKMDINTCDGKLLYNSLDTLATQIQERCASKQKT